eukprot:6183604-Pleurochrysis_carterae.AAC.1
MQSLPMLEALAQQKYVELVIFLAAEEGEVRGHSNGTKIYKKYRDVFKPYILNTINPALVSLLNKDYGIPSGKNKADIIVDLKKKLYDAEKSRKDAKATIQKGAAKCTKKQKTMEGDTPSPVEATAAEKAAAQAKREREEQALAEKHQKLRKTYDGGVVFLSWIHLGPWSEKPEPAFALCEANTPLLPEAATRSGQGKTRMTRTSMQLPSRRKHTESRQRLMHSSSWAAPISTAPTFARTRPRNSAEWLWCVQHSLHCCFAALSDARCCFYQQSRKHQMRAFALRSQISDKKKI